LERGAFYQGATGFATAAKAAIARLSRYA